MKGSPFTSIRKRSGSSGSDLSKSSVISYGETTFHPECPCNPQAVLTMNYSHHSICLLT